MVTGQTSPAARVRLLLFAAFVQERLNRNYSDSALNRARVQLSALSP
ncbi:hypothetical protein ABID59_006125 [Bradyrhizobium sp. S3.3.6]